MLRRFLDRFSKDTKIVTVVTVICIVVTIILLLNAIKYKTSDKVVVDAIITNIEQAYSTENGHTRVEYKLWGDYKYDGKRYLNIMCATVPSPEGYAVGDHLDVEVYENNPSEVAQDTSINFLFFVVFSAGLAFLSYKKIQKDYLAYYEEDETVSTPNEIEDENENTL